MKKILIVTTLALIGISIVGLPNSAFARYTIALNFMAENPVMFPVGSILPDDFSDASEIEFQDIDPFFTIFVSGEGPDRLYMLVRLEKEGRSIFTVNSDLFDINSILNRDLNNLELARLDEIRLGGGSNQISAENILPYIDANLLSDGLYLLKVILSKHSDWETAETDNHGSAVLPIQAVNRNEVRLENPPNQDVLRNNPVFQWSFPRREGVVFRLLVTSDVEVYADVAIPMDQNAAGDVTTYVYGTNNERPLDYRTYYWQVEANVSTMFENDPVDIHSPAFQFTYEQPGNKGGGEGLGDDLDEQPGRGDDLGYGSPGGGEGDGGLGGGLGGGPLDGNREEDEGPRNLDPIFTLLENVLEPDMYNRLISELDDPKAYSSIRIRIDGEVFTLQEFAIFMATYQPDIIAGTVSE